MKDFYDILALHEKNLSAVKMNKLSAADLKKFNNNKAKLLEKVVKYLDEFKVKYWLEGGALLGIYRDGKLIEKDNDVDLSMKIEDVGEPLFEMMDKIKEDDKLLIKSRGESLSYYKDAYAKKEIKPAKGYLRFDLPESESNGMTVNCDLFVWYPHKDIYFMIEDKAFRVHAKDLDKFSKIVYKGTSITIPKNTEAYLETVFTENWNKPLEEDDKKWNAYKEKFWCRWTDYKKELPSDYTFKWK
jgi:phosphorylcholine metabolism protein LicD